MRKVIVYKIIDNPKHKKVEDGKGEAVFHKWGVSYDEFESGPGAFSTAIVEREDGSIENVPVESIKFITPEPEKKVAMYAAPCPHCGREPTF